MISARPTQAEMGKPEASAFAEADDIRHGLEMFAGEEFPGAIEAGVNFIGDQQDFFLIANPPQHAAGNRGAER